MLSGELPETATYASRKWQWDPRGFLRIELKPIRKAPVETAVYAVEDLGELPGLMGRRFRLTKMFEAEQGEPYEVMVGGLARCSCQAGQFRAKVGIDCCRHLACLSAAYEAGAFEEMGVIGEANAR